MGKGSGDVFWTVSPLQAFRDSCLRPLAGAHNESGSDATAAQMTMVVIIPVSCTEARLVFLEQVIDVLHPGRANVSKVSFPDGPHRHIR